MMPSDCTTMLLGSRDIEPSATTAPGTVTLVGPEVMIVTLPLVTMVGASERTALKLNPKGVIGHDDGGSGGGG